MFKLTKILCCLFLVVSLLITFPSVAFLKKPQWLQLSKDDLTFWSQMSQDFAIDCDQNNPSVQRHIRWYQLHPQHLHHVLKESEPFIHYVYEQTRQKNLPAELALIPLLESQYNPAIGSRSGAAGLWQMMPGTASKFGLKINRCYDGRKDVTASTKAALNYLSYLYHYFNEDWLLALAAYDAGEGKVKAVTHRKHFCFWQLPLSKETKEYVPKLLAIAAIIKQPREYHVNLPNVATKSSIQESTWQEANVITDVKTSKKTHHLKSHKLNKGQPLTLPPIKNKSTGHRPKKYTIRSGDSLSSIAKKCHVSIKKLKKMNALKNEKTLQVGQTLLIAF
jgi:membrane-bound lytic murein transglycosylase D